MPSNPPKQLTLSPSQINDLRTQIEDIERELAKIKETLGIEPRHPRKTPPEPPYDPEQGVGRPTPRVISSVKRR